MLVDEWSRMFVMDGHADTLWAAGREQRDWAARSARGHTDLARCVDAGVNVQVFALFSDPAHRGEGFAVKALDMIDMFYSGMERAESMFPEGSLGILRSKGDLSKARRGGFWGLLSIEGGEALGGNLGALRAFYRLGVRALGLVWNHRNELADGIADRESGGGLTPFGKQVVRIMEELGMVVDVSHLSDPGFWDVVRTARQPIVASHSNARALCGHPRNLTDDQLAAVADCGGIIGINFCSAFLVESGRAGLDDVIDHIDHIVGKVGIDHVGLGTDYDGIDSPPLGLEDVTCLRALASALREHGYSEAAVQGVVGENWARIYAQLLPNT